MSLAGESKKAGNDFVMGDQQQPPVLSVENLSVQYFTLEGAIRAVDQVTFSINRSEIFCLVGESGCGKSTVALSILRLLSYPGKIVNGKILLSGEDLTNATERTMQQIRGRRIGMIFQDPATSLNPSLTIGGHIVEALRFHSKINRKDAKEIAIKKLAEVGIPNPSRSIDLYPHEFSGGMQQRAMIAVATACEPELLIADEPTSSLDVTVQAQFLNLLKSIQKSTRMSVLLITHNMGIVAEVADRVGVMYGGRFIEEAETGELFVNPMHPYSRALISCIPRADIKQTTISSIPGSVPYLAGKRNGCLYASRCRYALADCKDYDMQLREVRPNHLRSGEV
jgi:oligopeptide/dipeptide ABC transporter ATP-binding protein